MDTHTLEQWYDTQTLNQSALQFLIQSIQTPKTQLSQSADVLPIDRVTYIIRKNVKDIARSIEDQIGQLDNLPPDLSAQQHDHIARYLKDVWETGLRPYKNPTETPEANSAPGTQEHDSPTKDLRKEPTPTRPLLAAATRAIEALQSQLKDNNTRATILGLIQWGKPIAKVDQKKVFEELCRHDAATRQPGSAPNISDDDDIITALSSLFSETALEAPTPHSA